MLARAGIEHARREARRLLKGCRVTAPRHIVVEDFALRIGLAIIAAPLVGAVAQLISPRWGRPKILLSDRLVESEVRRFTIAHELAHYLLRHPSLSLAEMCDPLARGTERTWERNVEAEANAFAAELLVPEALVRPIFAGAQPSLEPALQIAHMFGVSVRVGAIRFTELTDAACAAVLSERGVVRWVARSATFRMSIAPGRSIDARSVAWAYFAGGDSTLEARHVPAAAWVDSALETSLMEHSIVCHDRGTVLTMLSTVPVALAAIPDAAA